MVTDDSDRRLNLYFDDFDLDVLEWLNSFGKRKRARVAKEAIRRAMSEGFRSPSQHNRPPTREIGGIKPPKILNPLMKDKNKPKNEDRPLRPTNDKPSEVDKVLLDLVGEEKDVAILNYLRTDEGVSF